MTFSKLPVASRAPSEEKSRSWLNDYLRKALVNLIRQSVASASSRERLLQLLRSRQRGVQRQTGHRLGQFLNQVWAKLERRTSNGRMIAGSQLGKNGCRYCILFCVIFLLRSMFHGYLQPPKKIMNTSLPPELDVRWHKHTHTHTPTCDTQTHTQMDYSTDTGGLT